MTTTENTTTVNESAEQEQEVATPPPAAPEAPEQSQETTEQEAPEPRSKGNAEAAKYRRQLRDTEAERDQLQTELRELRRQIEIERHKIPADYEYLLRTDGTDEDFQKSLEDVAQLANRPGVVKQSGRGDGNPTGEGPSWSDAFRSE
ncbi:hypothetical protein [Citricoccus sp. NR2]|uniref:hypothetical protein n=1 Tax=Citricoccus sp. NR2 TaxID=3004095 RepID=UPI0022DDBC66|nr:hypothetical protein [Citricoccus sp. NR2]WBL19206.1 hypothetical protein O1A05_00415 [Citricoccus sp. NR2]